jgi:predicted molibdopterin-dependent oxidoreductase YjgC
MFRRRPDAPAAATVTVAVEGRDIAVPEGASVAAAVLLAGLGAIRETGISAAPRAPYCLMGVCFDCLAEIDGVPNRQSCMVAAAPGMTIRRQHGKRAVEWNAGVTPACGGDGRGP